MNIKINEITRKIVFPNMEYKSNKYYTREWKENLVKLWFLWILAKIWLNVTFGELQSKKKEKKKEKRKKIIS